MIVITSFSCRILYGMTAAIFFLAGASILAVNTGLLPRVVSDVVMEESQGSLQTLHVAQELGTLLLFAGLITFWFLRHYEQSGFFHWALTIFWGLLALVHWIDVRGPDPDMAGNLVTSIPCVVFVAAGLLRAAFGPPKVHSCKSGDPT